jgi:hypothetical protein
MCHFIFHGFEAGMRKGGMPVVVKQRLPAIASLFCFYLARPPERAAEGATAKK